ncbi:hypothetical protein BHM03_00047515, partial [Ensete ventricosum]
AVKVKIGDRVALRKKLQSQVDRKDCVKDCKVDSMYRVWYNLRNTSSNMRFRGPTILVFSGFLSCVHVDLTLVFYDNTHTIGVSHCDFTGNGDRDPSLDSFYATNLKKNASAEMPPTKPRSWKLILEVSERSTSDTTGICSSEEGLFESDAALTTDDAAKASAILHDCEVGRRCRHNVHPSIPRRIANQKVGMRGEHYPLVDQEPFKDNGVAFEKVFDRYQIFPEYARGDRTRKKSRPSQTPPVWSRSISILVAIGQNLMWDPACLGPLVFLLDLAGIRVGCEISVGMLRDPTQLTVSDNIRRACRIRSGSSSLPPRK